MLLSFAQFEREVGAERVRDKIASSKKKGMWMGGVVPLGYDVVDRKLIVNLAEAETVRLIFARYLALGSVSLLEEDLRGRGITSKQTTGQRSGVARGGATFTRGALYNLLHNVIYVGKVAHGHDAYPGQHEPLVKPEVFEKAQAMLASGRAERRHGGSAREPSLLVGLVFDEQGHKLTPSHTTKGARRFRYYVGESTQSPGARQFRVPAGELERQVIGIVTEWLRDEHTVERAIAPTGADAVALEALLLAARDCATRLVASAGAGVRGQLTSLIERVTVGKTLSIALRGGALYEMAQLAPPQREPSSAVLTMPCQLVRRSREVRLAVAPKAAPSDRHLDPSLVKLLVKAHSARETLLSAGGASLAEVAAMEGHEPHYFSVLVKLSYLAPDIVETIFAGRQGLKVNRQVLARQRRMPIAWTEQYALLRFMSGVELPHVHP